MTTNRYAEDANYWQTTVHAARSMGEVIELLEKFGVQRHELRQGQTGGRSAWMIRFEWREATYRFVFVPLECQYPDKVSSFGGTKRPHHKQAEYQTGRRALHFIKAILVAADDQPAALFGFIELPGVSHPSGIPATAAELDVRGLTEKLPELTVSGIGILTDGSGPGA